MARRYTYTPRRSGQPARPPASRTPLLPILLAGAAVLVAVWFATRGDDPSITPPGADVLALNQTPTATRAAGRATTGPLVRPSATPFALSGSAPPVTAFSAAVIEEPCGAVVYSLNGDLRLPPASLTKMMTALLVAENEDPARIIESRIDGFVLSLETDSTVMGLKLGDRLSVTDLLYGLLLRSGNDAALTLAQAVAGSEDDFVDMMNAKADELGLADTHFDNPHGLDANAHYSSALDMAAIGRALLDAPLLAEIVRTPTYTPDWDRGYFDNINLLLTNYDGAIGVKTGYTDGAGLAIVGAAERDGRRLVVSVMRSEELYVDAASLLDWAFATEPACDGPAQAAAAQ